MDDVVINGDEPQGQKLFEALDHPEVKHIFRKLPEDSLAKAILDVSKCMYMAHGAGVRALVYAKSVTDSDGRVIYVLRRSYVALPCVCGRLEESHPLEILTCDGPNNSRLATCQDNREWNLWHGSSKGWRFNEKVLRWSLYALARIGSAGYEILREILHLPTASHVRKLRGAAAPIQAGIQRQNIKV